MNILITGGTGSFGQAFIEKLLLYAWPTKICIYSRDEHKQEQMAKRLNDERLRFFIGDVRDLERLKLAMRGVDFVVHAAALKIVPSAEYNPFEYIKTNVLGTQNVVDAALYNDVKKVIMLSTDKAVYPINLYGATKLTAEKIIIAANNIKGDLSSLFSVVRYGNVANSNGSVIKVFQEQLKANVPKITITDLMMTRFWITLDDATQFVIEALNWMQGGEIFIPNMPKFYISHLARVMAKRAGKENEYAFVYTGIRPGEKLYESIYTDYEAHRLFQNKVNGNYIIAYKCQNIAYEKVEADGALNSDSEKVLTLYDKDLDEELEDLGL